MAESIVKDNQNINFSIIERGGMSVERMFMKPNPTESIHCGRNDCKGCNQESELKRIFAEKLIYCMTGLLEYVQIPNTQDSPPKIITQGVINMKGLIKTGQNMNIMKPIIEERNIQNQVTIHLCMPIRKRNITLLH